MNIRTAFNCSNELALIDYLPMLLPVAKDLMKYVTVELSVAS